MNTRTVLESLCLANKPDHQGDNFCIPRLQGYPMVASVLWSEDQYWRSCGGYGQLLHACWSHDVQNVAPPLTNCTLCPTSTDSGIEWVWKYQCVLGFSFYICADLDCHAIYGDVNRKACKSIERLAVSAYLLDLTAGFFFFFFFALAFYDF